MGQHRCRRHVLRLQHHRPRAVHRPRPQARAPGSVAVRRWALGSVPPGFFSFFGRQARVGDAVPPAAEPQYGPGSHSHGTLGGLPINGEDGIGQPQKVWNFMRALPGGPFPPQALTRGLTLDGYVQLRWGTSPFHTHFRTPPPSLLASARLCPLRGASALFCSLLLTFARPACCCWPCLCCSHCRAPCALPARCLSCALRSCWAQLHLDRDL